MADKPASWSHYPRIKAVREGSQYVNTTSEPDDMDMDVAPAPKRGKLEPAYQAITHTSKEEKHFPFLELPAELRHIVYGFAMNSHQRVQIPYPRSPMVPGQQSLRRNPGFNILLLNKQVHGEAIDLFRKHCTVYLPVNVHSMVDVFWGAVQRKQHSAIVPSIYTSLMALAYSKNVRLNFYSTSTGAVIGCHRLDYQDLWQAAERLREFANMLDTVQMENQARRQVTLYVWVGISALLTKQADRTSSADAFASLLDSANSAARQGRAHTDWKVVARVYSADDDSRTLKIIERFKEDAPLATTYKYAGVSIGGHHLPNAIILCKDDPDVVLKPKI
jgi:hypothetical protein